MQSKYITRTNNNMQYYSLFYVIQKLMLLKLITLHTWIAGPRCVSALMFHHDKAFANQIDQIWYDRESRGRLIPTKEQTELELW